MHRTAFIIAATAVLIAISARAQDDAAALPVKRVVLYKNGVGYFEHVGAVKDNQSVAITFTTGQLDDVLKSLTVLDHAGGRITGVTYGSSAPVDRQLADLRLNTGEKATLTEFLGALRGARVEIRMGATTVAGRLLSVERKTRTGGGATVEVDYISLITDAGEMRTTELASGFSVRLLDPALNGTVKRYLDLVSSSRQPDERKMTIATAGSGSRTIAVSYISETPVWKATYRIVLPDKEQEKPLLQGWAIVDNVGGQDWDKVELSLVAGAPQSFVQKLSTPYYSRRPVASIKESLSAAPQTFDAPVFITGRLTGTVRDPAGAVVAGARVKVFDAAGALLGEATTDTRGQYGVATVPDGTLRLEVDSPGFRTTQQYLVATAGQPVSGDAQLQIGSSAESVTVTENAPTVMTQMAVASNGRTGSGRAMGSGSTVGRSVAGGIETGRGAGFGPGSGGGVGGGAFRVAETVAAEDLGDLFEYKLKEPISIRKSQSALVPIVQAGVSAEKVSIWNDRAGLPRPLRALWLENTSGLTLDGGSFNVLESGVFAGEGIFDSIRPGEKRLMSYAADLALTPDLKPVAFVQRTTRARVSRGVLAIVKEQAESKTYTFRNADGSARTVIVEHPARPGYELRSQVKPVETSSASMRFRVPVPARQTASLVVDEARPIETTYQISNLNSDQIALFLREKSINAEIETALRKVLDQKAVVAAFDSQKDAREEESKRIYDDQQRLRENIRALKGSAEEKALIQRYTKQLNDQENRLEQLSKETEDLAAKQEQAQAELDKTIQGLAFDIRM